MWPAFGFVGTAQPSSALRQLRHYAVRRFKQKIFMLFKESLGPFSQEDLDPFSQKAGSFLQENRYVP